MTTEIMKDPVVTHDGQVYERSGINEWFRSRRSQHGSGKSSASKASAFKREKSSVSDVSNSIFRN